MNRQTMPLSLAVLTLAFAACDRANPVSPYLRVASRDAAELAVASARSAVTLYIGQHVTLPGVNSRRVRLSKWSSSNPAVVSATQQGVVTGLSVGEAVVSSTDGLTALVRVLGRVSEPGQLTTLRISPRSVTLSRGASQQFVTTANWSTGATDVPPISYFASGGSISAGGLFVAPSVAGTYLVIVAHTGGTLRDTATVTITATGTDPTPPPPPTFPPPTFPPPTFPPPTLPPPTFPPPAPSAFTPNLPTSAGLLLRTDTRFGNLVSNQLNGDGLAYVWDGRNAIDPTAPYGPAVFETFYPGNTLGNGVGGANLYGAGGNHWRRLYFSIMVWVPSSYSIHSNGEKFFYPLITTNGQVTASAPINWQGINYGPSGPQFGFVMVRRPGQPAGPQNGNGMVTKGRWTLIEMYLEMNSPGSTNGVWRAWVDGTLAADWTDVVYSSAGTQSYFDAMRFDGTRGGGASTIPTPPEGQVRRYNRLAFYASE